MANLNKNSKNLIRTGPYELRSQTLSMINVFIRAKFDLLVFVYLMACSPKRIFQFGKQKSLRRAKSAEYNGWAMSLVLCLAKYPKH